MLTESINCDYYSIFHIINKKYLKKHVTHNLKKISYLTKLI